VTAAIRSYEQIRKINDSRRGLNQIVHASTQLMALHGVQNFAAGVLAQIADLLGWKPTACCACRNARTPAATS
jgi:hypothetical protein